MSAPPAITSIIASLAALVVAAAGQSETTPLAATNAYRAAIQRKGGQLVEAGGLDAMTSAIAFLRYQAPEKADRYEAIVSEAWSDVPGWATRGRQL